MLKYIIISFLIIYICCVLFFFADGILESLAKSEVMAAMQKRRKDVIAIFFKIINFLINFNGGYLLYLIIKLTHRTNSSSNDSSSSDSKFYLLMSQLEIIGELVNLIVRFSLSYLTEGKDEVIFLMLPIISRIFAAIISILSSKNIDLIKIFIFCIKIFEKAASTSWALLREKVTLKHFMHDLTSLNYGRSAGVIISGIISYILEKNKFTSDIAVEVGLWIILVSTIISGILILIIYIFFVKKNIYNHKNDEDKDYKDNKNDEDNNFDFKKYMTAPFILFLIFLGALSILRLPESMIVSLLMTKFAPDYGQLFFAINNVFIIIITFFIKKYFKLNAKKLLLFYAIGLIIGYGCLLLAIIYEGIDIYQHAFLCLSFIGWSIIRYSSQLFPALILTEKFSNYPQGLTLAIIITYQSWCSSISNYIFASVTDILDIKYILLILCLSAAILLWAIRRFYK